MTCSRVAAAGAAALTLAVAAGASAATGGSPRIPGTDTGAALGRRRLSGSLTVAGAPCRLIGNPPLVIPGIGNGTGSGGPPNGSGEPEDDTFCSV